MLYAACLELNILNSPRRVDLAAWRSGAPVQVVVSVHVLVLFPAPTLVLVLLRIPQYQLWDHLHTSIGVCACLLRPNPRLGTSNAGTSGPGSVKPRVQAVLPEWPDSRWGYPAAASTATHRTPLLLLVLEPLSAV